MGRLVTPGPSGPPNAGRRPSRTGRRAAIVPGLVWLHSSAALTKGPLLVHPRGGSQQRTWCPQLRSQLPGCPMARMQHGARRSGMHWTVLGSPPCESPGPVRNSTRPSFCAAPRTFTQHPQPINSHTPTPTHHPRGSHVDAAEKGNGADVGGVGKGADRYWSLQRQVQLQLGTHVRRLHRTPRTARLSKVQAARRPGLRPTGCSRTHGRRPASTVPP